MMKAPEACAHWDYVVAYLQTRMTHAAAKALNGIIQTIKRRSRGFRAVEYFTAMIYLVASHLTFELQDLTKTTHTKSPCGSFPHLHASKKAAEIFQAPFFRDADLAFN